MSLTTRLTGKKQQFQSAGMYNCNATIDIDISSRAFRYFKHIFCIKPYALSEFRRNPSKM